MNLKSVAGTLMILAVVMTGTVALAAVQSNTWTPVTITVYVPCANGGAGELVDLSGPLHVLMSFTLNGNNVSGYQHFQPSNVTGIGESTGVKYQANGVTQSSFQGSLQNGQLTQTFVNNFYIVSQGSSANYMIHENAHVTINANGIVTVAHDNFNATCQ